MFNGSIENDLLKKCNRLKFKNLIIYKEKPIFSTIKYCFYAKI